MSIYIAIPCMDKVDVEFVKSLMSFRLPPKTAYGFTVASLTYDARNTLAKAACESECDRVMWVDSDMTFDPDTVMKLSADIDEGREFVSGLYFTRKNPVKPVVFKTLGFKETSDGKQESYAGFYMDYPRDEIFQIKAAGFGCVMTTTKLLKQITDKYGCPFMPYPGLGEDLSFCKRCEEQEIPMYCDSRIKAGHIGTTVVTEESFDNGLIL